MKGCLIIGPSTALQYGEMYNLLKDNVLRLGHNGYLERMGFWFIGQDGEKHRVGSTVFTTLKVRREKNFTLTKTYNEKDYPKYDNYDAIECKYKNNLPIDYEGKIGVPVSFWFYYPELDYEVLEHRGDLKVNGKTVFGRLIIKKKK